MVVGGTKIDGNLAHWHVNHAQTQQEHDHLVVGDEGNPYWITSRLRLPENFQLTMTCKIEFVNARKKIYGGADSARVLCLRFSTADTTAKIAQLSGYHIRLSADSVVLSKEGQFLHGVKEGNTGLPCQITVTKHARQITIALNDKILLEHRDDQPLAGGFPLSVGGFFSRLYLKEILVMDLDDD